MIKLFDVCITATLILLLAPLFLICIVILLLTGEGKVFYLQERIGLNKRPFKLIKFATMLKDSPSMSTGTLTIKDDPRVLPFGKYLRKTKVNELPQLLNVILGDMALVGPRPQAFKNYNLYNEKDREIISSVKPGITGIGSLVFRSEENLLQSSDSEHLYQNLIMPYKAELERYYISNQNFFLNIKILSLTALLLFGKDATIVYRFFPNMPALPPELRAYFHQEEKFNQ